MSTTVILWFCSYPANQAKLREMEEKNKLKRKVTGVQSRRQPGGSISPFSLGSVSRQYSQQEAVADSHPSQLPTDTGAQPFSPPTHAKDSHEEGSSVARWIGSWIGWR